MGIGVGNFRRDIDGSEEVIIKCHHPVGSESSAGFYIFKQRDELTLHIDRIICFL